MRSLELPLLQCHKLGMAFARSPIGFEMPSRRAGTTMRNQRQPLFSFLGGDYETLISCKQHISNYSLDSYGGDDCGGLFSPWNQVYRKLLPEANPML